MDLSELFKSGFQSLHKKILDKNYQQKTLRSRMEDFSFNRRQTRDTLLLQKRNLDLNISPYVTPEPSKQEKASVRAESAETKKKPKNVETKTSKRLEMLKKWKDEKEKRKQEEKKKTKPIFKVCHIPKDLGLAKFEKEKSPKPQEKFISKFAPKDHKFQAPKNIKPMYITGSESKPGKLIETRQKTQQPKMNRDKTKATTKLPQKDALPSKPLRMPNKGLGKNQLPEVNKGNGPKKIQNSDAKTTDKTKKKVVEWNLPNKDGQSGLNGQTTPDKKTYQKTPQKRKNEKKNTNGIDIAIDLDKKSKTVNRSKKTTEQKIKKDDVYSDEGILKTPTRKQIKAKDKSSSESKLEFGNEGTKTKRKESCSESEFARVDDKNQVLAGPSQNPTELNGSPKNTQKLIQTREPSPLVDYISPFVTISRGKDYARKEFQARQSTGGTFPETPEGRHDFSARTSPKMGAEYFMKMLNKEIDRIESVCREWEKYKENEIPEEAINLIDVAVGQSKLLINKKFEQFRSLIEECRSCKYKEKPITCTDLHGFWDMVYVQVGDLDKRFANLEALKLNDWKEVITEKKVVPPKKPRGRPKKVTATSSIRDAIRAARNKMKNGEAPLEDPPIITMIKSPVAGPSASNPPSSLRRSLRVSLLVGQKAYNSKRASYSPGLTIMKVTQAIKAGDGLTPSRSILKTDLTKSEKRTVKSVLFKDDLEDEVRGNRQSSDVSSEVDKENNASSLNSICFSPVTPTRRSQRLCKKSLNFKVPKS